MTELTVVGMTMLQAETLPASTGSRLQFTVKSEQVDPSVPPETILRQTGKPLTALTAYLSVSIAVPQASSCTQTQLALGYLSAQPATSEDFGWLVVRNTSASWCVFSGPVIVTGVGGTGRAVTNTLTENVPAPFELSPGATTPAPGPLVDTATPPQPDNGITPPGRVQALVGMGALYGCGLPSTQRSPTSVRVVPAVLALALPGGITLRAPNQSYTTTHVDFPQFVACGGQVHALALPTVTLR